ncbi:type II secretion system protein [Candidatus Campbellbacteria bacterium]|nr:MAG: type II secretion system protein [Candidatus Campbellbacteria bacterium]
MKKFTRGFTLIELLVVIAIIGILSSVVLASLNSAREKARDAKRISDIKQIQLALELYADSHAGLYPAATSSLVTTYMPSWPVAPAGSPAGYQYAGLATTGTACNSYHVGVLLEQTTHTALNSDSNATAGTACSGSDADFNGTAAGVYDLKP